MKRPNPPSIAATFASAILSLALPAPALPADDTVRPHRDALLLPQPPIEPSRGDPLRDDPILKSTWGPGDPDLAVPKFHFTLGAKPPRPNGNGKAGGPE